MERAVPIRTIPPYIAFRAIAPLILASFTFVGCALDVRRDRFSVPLERDKFEQLEVGETDLDTALETLGAPDIVERENDADADHLWWLHKDAADISIRLQVPLSYFGYRHNVFQYFQGDDQTNKIHLTFDDAGQLTQKDMILAPGYESATGPEPPNRIHIAPRVEHSMFLSGSGDFADYDELFENGLLLGLDLNYQPVAPLVIGIGANYQTYEGEIIQNAGGNLRVRQSGLAHLGADDSSTDSFEVFGSLFDYAQVRRILLDEDPRSADGWIVFVEGGAGVTYNDDVLVTRGGITTNFFDEGIGFSSSASAGIEYSMEHVSFRVGLDFRNADAFDSGNSGLPDDASAFRSVLGMASLAVKF